MRRIKTYVLMVGVSLSVAPIFHSTQAQQGSGNTQLLLDVQTLRQEIAELRDMVERQQYQMKRMQRTIDSQGGSNPAGAAFGQSQQNTGYSSTSQGLPQAALSNEPQTVRSFQTQAQQANLNEQAPVDQGLYQGAQNVNTQVNQTNLNASQQLDSAANNSNAYPPVVDRSFSTTSPSVPVTGAGVQRGINSQVGSQINAQELNQSAQQAASNVQGSVQGAATQYQTQRYNGNALPSSGGVIAVPELSNGASGAVSQAVNQAQAAKQSAQVFNQGGQVASQQLAQAGQGINAAQVPIPTNTQQALASNVAVRQESEFYSEGIALLKQSQYEQAAVVFEQQLEAHPGGNLADGAHYWIAEAMFLNRKLDVAKSHLKTIINDYPQSTRIPNAMLKTAYIEQSQGNQIEARILFQEIVALYPQSDAAIAAKNQLSSQN